MATPVGAVHDVRPVEVNDSTMYFVPFVVPAIEELLPVKDVRPPVEDAVLVMVTFPVDAEEFEFPAVSVNDPDETVMTPVPPDVRYGV